MINITTGMKLHGFTVKRVRSVSELNGTFVEMVHDKTGAELCHMDNKVQNKLFSVAFKTLPEDSTGVFHILEHSVLCGSQKYPVKEPFVDLLKSSMNTFLNAMTFPDMTVYPVSSRNERDFLNLTSVYLDAVFAPALLDNPNIFYQEGIHVEVNGEKPYYKGVVFNEMKGAMSGVDDRIESNMNRLLFPDNCYRFNSGGEPEEIPNLTYEKFVDTYRRFYHPSNARFFLDGDVPLEDTLALIDSYLNKYEKSDARFEIPVQNPVSGGLCRHYEISDDEENEGRAILALGKIIGSWEDKNRIFASKVLCDVLTDSNEAPLKRAILSSGLAEDLEMAVLDGRAQPYLMLVVRNMEDSDSGKVREIINNTIEKLINDGIDKESILASINRFSFGSRQMPEPQGLNRMFSSHSSWLYGGDPLLYLVYDESIEYLRQMAENGGFEELLGDLFNKDVDFSTLHMLPSLTLGKEERDAEDERLKKEISALNEEELKKITAQNEKLLEWQQTPDSKEAAETLPTLSLSELRDTPELIETVETSRDGVTVLYHPLDTHGIVYLSMYFSLTDFSLDEITKISFISEFFGELPTEKSDTWELRKRIKTYIGSLSFRVDVFGKDADDDTCTPCLIVRAGILKENLSEAKSLLSEILLQTKFDDSDKIREIIMQNDDMARQIIVENGNAFGMSAVYAHYSSKGAVREATGGYSSLKFLHNFAKNFDDMAQDFIYLLNRVKSEVICKSRLTVGVTASTEISLADMLPEIPEGSGDCREACSYKTELPQRMGIRIPARVAYAVKGYRLSQCNAKMSGTLRVAANIISLGYLWNVVRVQGGAYGAGFAAGRDGDIACYSYRDPSPGRSLCAYDDIADFIDEFCDSDEDLDKFIISAVAATEPLTTPADKGVIADEFWFSGVSDDDRIENRRQMIATDRESLRGWKPVLKKMAEDGVVCVVGDDEALSECGEITIFEL